MHAQARPDHRRALELLAGNPNHCTEALMLAHGIARDVLADLTLAGLARSDAERMLGGADVPPSGSRPPAGASLNDYRLPTTATGRPWRRRLLIERELPRAAARLRGNGAAAIWAPAPRKRSLGRESHGCSSFIFVFLS
jgi:hypothetical protein